MNVCDHCPRPADLQLGDEDGTQSMCLGCLTALLEGLTRHHIPTVLLLSTPTVPAMAGVA